MAEAGYDPKEMARFFNKLNSEGGSRGPQFLSDHPNPLNREAAIEAEVRTLPSRQYGFTTGDFARAKAEVARMPKAAVTPGGSGAGAVSAGPVGSPDTTVSNNFRTLNNSAYSLQYPDNWQVSGESSGTVTIAPRNGVVRQSVGLGALVSLYRPQENRPVDLHRDTRDLIARFQSSDQALDISGSTQRSRIDNRDALQTVFVGNSPFGGKEQDTLITVATAQGLFYIVTVTPQAQAGAVQPAFNRIIRSIRLSQ
jgi:hypothetical protein